MDIYSRLQISYRAQVEAIIAPLCAGLAPAVAEQLSRFARIQSYRAGTTILTEQVDNNFVGIVISGILRMQVERPDGHIQIVGLLLRNDIFGKPFARASNVTIEAATDSALCSFERASFERLLATFPELEHRMLLSLSHELDVAQQWMGLLARQTITERFAAFLVMLGVRERMQAGKPPEVVNGQIIEVAITRRDVAACLGTTVESISRSVQQLVRSSVLQVVDPHHFLVLDSCRLTKDSYR